MRELKSNYGLGTIRRHGFMANWAWLLLVCLAHNLCCWTQQLGRLAAGRDGADLRAKRLRYRYLVVPASSFAAPASSPSGSPPPTPTSPGSSPRSTGSNASPHSRPEPLPGSDNRCPTRAGEPARPHRDPRSRSPQQRTTLAPPTHSSTTYRWI